jgi:hypothetical protein
LAFPAVLLLVGGISTACGRHGVALGTATPTATPVSLVKYTNPAYPYEIGYPRGWQQSVGNPDSIHFDGKQGQRLSVDVQAVPQQQPALNLPAYADMQVEALRKSTPQLVELQRSRIPLPNNGSGVEVDVMWSEGSVQRRALLLYVLDAGIGFVARAEAPASAFPAERRELDTALRSFTITPPD